MIEHDTTPEHDIGLYAGREEAAQMVLDTVRTGKLPLCPPSSLRTALEAVLELRQACEDAIEQAHADIRRAACGEPTRRCIDLTKIAKALAPREKS